MEESLEEMSSIPSLEITRNPFESINEEKINFPSLASPSVFKNQTTPASDRRRKEFRWSIEQISRLKPAEIDECPNQEYSSTFDREEDEAKAQQAIDEFFSQEQILPSPWTPKSGGSSVKHVTFSPHPPQTAFIRDSSLDSSYSETSSCNNSSLQNIGKVDACCQTKLTLPPELDLEKLLGPQFFSYHDDDLEQSTSLSSLRRKLFSQGESSPVKTHPQPTGHQITSPIKRRSILESPNNRQCTSSPVKNMETNFQDVFESSMTDVTPSPNISPIRPTAQSTINHLANQGCSFSPVKTDGLVENSVFESSDIQSAPFPELMFSPIKSETAMDCDEEIVRKGEANNNSRSSLDDGGPLEISSLGTCDNESKNSIALDVQKNTHANIMNMDQEQSKQIDEGCIKDTLQEKHRQFILHDKKVENDMEDSDKNQSPVGNYVQGQRTKGEFRTKINHGIKGNEVINTNFIVDNKALDIDDEILMVRAHVALRRAEKFLNFSKSQDSGIQSLTGINTYNSHLSGGTFHPGQPVGMSTPMVPLHHHSNQVASLSSFAVTNSYGVLPKFKVGQEESVLNDSSLPDILTKSDLRESSRMTNEDISKGREIISEIKSFGNEKQSLLPGMNKLLGNTSLLYKTPSPQPRERVGESLTWPVITNSKVYGSYNRRPVLISQIPPPAKLPRTSAFSYPLSSMEWNMDKPFSDWKDRVRDWERAVRNKQLLES